jgi:hypothetical protein
LRLEGVDDDFCKPGWATVAGMGFFLRLERILKARVHQSELIVLSFRARSDCTMQPPGACVIGAAGVQTGTVKNGDSGRSEHWQQRQFN